MDTAILNWIYENLTSPLLDNIMPYITSLGEGGVLYIITALVLLTHKKGRVLGLAILLALIIESVSVNLILKPLVGRIRPFDLNGITDLIINAPTDYSFPSGHTGAAFAFATVILLGNRKWGIVAIIVAVLIAFSRLYLYVHWPSDVLAGTGIGILSALIAVSTFTKTALKDRFSYNCFIKD